jgi:stage V sporulation protein G
MQITKVKIRPANEELVKAYASICFDDCFVVHDISVIEAPTGLSISFPTKQVSDGTHWDVAFPASTETRRTIERAILAEYAKVVGSGGSVRRKNSVRHNLQRAILP